MGTARAGFSGAGAGGLPASRAGSSARSGAAEALCCSFPVELRKNSPAGRPSARLIAQMIHLEYFMVLFTVTGIGVPTSLPARQDTPSTPGGQLPAVLQRLRPAGLFQRLLFLQEILVVRKLLQRVEKKIFCLWGARI